MTIEQLLVRTMVQGHGDTTHRRGGHVSYDAVVREFGRQDSKGAAWQMLAYGLEYAEPHGKHRLVLILLAAAQVCALLAALMRGST